MLVSAKTNIAGSCISGFDQAAAIAAQQIGGEGSDNVAVLFGHALQKGSPIGVGDLIELPTQHGDAGFGIDARAADIVMAEKLLDVGDVHPDRQQVGGHGMPEQVWIQTLGDLCFAGNGADDLPDPLSGIKPNIVAPALLSADE